MKLSLKPTYLPGVVLYLKYYYKNKLPQTINKSEYTNKYEHNKINQ